MAHRRESDLKNAVDYWLSCPRGIQASGRLPNSPYIHLELGLYGSVLHPKNTNSTGMRPAPAPYELESDYSPWVRVVFTKISGRTIAKRRRRKSRVEDSEVAQATRSSVELSMNKVWGLTG